MKLKTVCATLALIAFGTVAQAQSYPSKPITLVVPYPPGGNVDVSARILQRALDGAFDQPVVVENRPGGGGMIAGAYVAKAEADGHTLFVGSNGPILFGPMTSANAPYQWDEAFEPVSALSMATNLLLVKKDFPARTLEEFIAHAAAHPGEVLVGISSLVSINHFMGVQLKTDAGVDWTEVLYNGNAPAIADLVAGQIDAGFQQLVSARQHIESGAIRALAVGGEERSALLPDVPTMGELGYPAVSAVTFNGIFAPKGTPPEVIELLSEKIRGALATPEAVEQFATLGSVTGGSTPAEFRTILETESAKWGELARASVAE